MRLELSYVDRPEFTGADVVTVVRDGTVWSGPRRDQVEVGQLREIAPDLYGLLVDGVPVARPDGELHRIFGRAEAAIELAVIAKQEVKS